MKRPVSIWLALKNWNASTSRKLTLLRGPDKIDLYVGTAVTD